MRAGIFGGGMKYDQHENCAKCGYPGKTVEYTERQRYEPIGHGIAVLYDGFLELRCSRCGFKWVRDCLDKEEA